MTKSGPPDLDSYSKVHCGASKRRSQKVGLFRALPGRPPRWPRGHRAVARTHGDLRVVMRSLSSSASSSSSSSLRSEIVFVFLFASSSSSSSSLRSEIVFVFLFASSSSSSSSLRSEIVFVFLFASASSRQRFFSCARRRRDDLHGRHDRRQLDAELDSGGPAGRPKSP